VYFKGKKMSNESIETRIATLEAEVKVLKERCDNFSLCVLDSHADARQFAHRMNEYNNQLREYNEKTTLVSNKIAKEIVAPMLAQANAALERTQANVQKIVAQTKAALSPEKISEAAIAAVTPGKIADELSKRVLTVRPASREELKAGSALAVRQITRAEQNNS
jgi:hypothetical protein